MPRKSTSRKATKRRYRKPKSLAEALDRIRAPEVCEDDLREIALQLMAENTGDTAGHARAQVELLKLLGDWIIPPKREAAQASMLTPEQVRALLSAPLPDDPGTSGKDK